ncbi:MAG: hypothetical protein HPY55_04355 [Firmicutes bacterium]|nr:hypothetical protein [Bacillota bacterium]
MKPTSSEEIELNIQPDPSVLFKLGRSNFTLAFALGEFIDNAYDARGTTCPVVVEITTDEQHKTIIVSDNASGMDAEELEAALTVGRTKKDKDHIGIFGFGLKAAATYLSERFRIETCKKGGATILKVDVDSRTFDKWQLRAEAFPVSSSTSHGSRLTLSEVNVSLGNSEIEKAKREIAEVYHRLIVSGRLEVLVNGEPIKAPAFDLISGLKWDIDFDVNGKRVHGWVGAGRPVRMGGQMNFTPGFYLVRKDRVVKKGEWIGVKPHSRLRTMVGEIQLDDFEVNNNKTDFLRGTPAWVALESQMTQTIASLKLKKTIYTGTTKKSRFKVSSAGEDTTPGPSNQQAPQGHQTKGPASRTSAATPQPNAPAPAPSKPEHPTTAEDGNKPMVFVVHGLDHVARDECVKMLKELGLYPIILQESPATALMAILDKFELYAKKSVYAVVMGLLKKSLSSDVGLGCCQIGPQG